MSERDFQMALLHLYRTIDQEQTYSDAIFARFALSYSEKQWLKELMVSQREGLLFFNEQLHTKRCRFLRHALPNSQRALAERFEELLDSYALYSGLEGTVDAADAVRRFADYIGGQIREGGSASKELEFVQFEALQASVSLWPDSPDRPAELSSDLRLALGEDAVLVSCSYDCAAAIQDLSLLEAAGRRATPQWFLLFRDEGGALRTFAIAPRLAEVLSFFGGGHSLNEVLQRLELVSEKVAASRTFAELLQLGVPFFLPGRPAGRVRMTAIK
jgi:hypothetical protein